ncbi:hypothetical protein [Hydrocoleum sp. CS-953]|uniref:hypothetical protein n=1 Tax=Microcoleaceae TaxID=1892252 RepID=UPI000B9AFD0F|nr:hypothetical protein [Hydrocoleum sp. CS-953]MDJ0518316.1 hypothetical protein [Trichodesmium sp. MO_231.B1]OZH52630.1 hypothetical protein AFK68_23140 [Hydrocoleum sp. CS-953]
MKSILAWVISVLLALTCFGINPTIAAAQEQVIVIENDIEDDGDWTVGSDDHFKPDGMSGCSSTAGAYTLGMANSFPKYGGKAFVNFDFPLVAGDYAVTINVCNFNHPIDENGVPAKLAHADYIGLTVGGDKENPGTLLTTAVETSSSKPRPEWTEIKEWSFNYTFADNDPNLGSKIGFLIDVPVKGEFLNMSFDDLKIKITPKS